jgi:hypothetical protein
MFNIVRNREFGEHAVRLTVDSPDVRLFSVSFVSSVIPDAVKIPVGMN